MARARRHLTYANVMATIAVFGLLGGAGAYAAAKLGKNSVKSSTIKDGQVKTADLAGGAVTATKLGAGSVGSIQLADGSVGTSKLGAGAVGTGQLANGSVTFAKLQPPDGFTSLGFGDSQNGGACGLIGFVNTWADLTPNVNNGASYYRDPYGVVHLRGVVTKCGAPPSGDVVFTLPAGLHPARQEVQATIYSTGIGRVDVDPNGDVIARNPPAPGAGTWVSLDGLSFRCAPSGASGCP